MSQASIPQASQTQPTPQQAAPAAQPQQPMPQQPSGPVNLQQALVKIVIAGKKVMYSPQMHPMLLQGLRSGAAPADILATQIAGLLKLLDDKSGMNIPKQIMFPAGVLLIADLADFCKKTKLLTIGKDDIKIAIQKMFVILVKEYHLYDKRVAAAHAFQAQNQQPPGQAPQQPVQPTQQAAQPPGIVGQAQGAQ